MVDPVTITHGMQLTTSLVGPAGISISTFTTVPGGTFTGKALSSWGSLARTVAKGGEVIDGFTFLKEQLCCKALTLVQGSR